MVNLALFYENGKKLIMKLDILSPNKGRPKSKENLKELKQTYLNFTVKVDRSYQFLPTSQFFPGCHETAILPQTNTPLLVTGLPPPHPTQSPLGSLKCGDDVIISRTFISGHLGLGDPAANSVLVISKYHKTTWQENKILNTSSANSSL